MKRIYGIILPLVIVCLPLGCASAGKKQEAKEGETYAVPMRGRIFSREEIVALVRRERDGDGEAAFALYSHYSLGDYNERLSEKYRKRCD